MKRPILLFLLALSTGLGASIGACGSGGSRPASPSTTEPGPGETPSTKPPSKPAKNLQVLPKDMPLDEVTALMKQNVAPALGVECSYCHVENDFAADEKADKEVARDMMRMAMEMNETHFGGEMKVMCFTCHQGKAKPDEGVTPLVK